MSTHHDDFAALLERVRDGSEDACVELVERYGSFVYRAVRRKLNWKMRSTFDSGDFMQAVWASFFEDRKCLVELPTARDLVFYLTSLARNKVIGEFRRRYVAEYAVHREV